MLLLISTHISIFNVFLSKSKVFWPTENDKLLRNTSIKSTVTNLQSYLPIKCQQIFLSVKY